MPNLSPLSLQLRNAQISDLSQVLKVTDICTLPAHISALDIPEVTVGYLQRSSSALGRKSSKATQVSNPMISMVYYSLVSGFGGDVISRGYLKTAECLVAWSSPA
jgi:hypothetical protein